MLCLYMSEFGFPKPEKNKAIIMTAEELQAEQRRLAGKDPEDSGRIIPGSEASEKLRMQNMRRRREAIVLTADQAAEAKQLYQQQEESRKKIMEDLEAKKVQRQQEEERKIAELQARLNEPDEHEDVQFQDAPTQPGILSPMQRFTPTQEINLNRPNPKKVETKIINRPEEKQKSWWDRIRGK